jgi:hypothetical protein
MTEYSRELVELAVKLALEQAEAEIAKLRTALEEIKRVTDFTSFHGHLMEGSDADHRAHEISCDALASMQIP